MSAMHPDDPPPLDEGEYAVLQVPDAWHVLSLIFFIAALGARFLVRFLPQGRGIFYRPVLTAFSVPVLAGLSSPVSGCSSDSSPCATRRRAGSHGWRSS
jgi:hypothetical protein